MQKIRLRIRDALPERCSERVIVLPNHLDEMGIPPAIEVIALYFDKPQKKFDAAHEFHIPTWPARSSDHQVNQLAALLKRPMPVRSTPEPSTSRARADKSQDNASNESRHEKSSKAKQVRDPANRAALIGLLVVVGTLYFFGDSDGSSPVEEEQVQMLENRQEPERAESSPAEAEPKLAQTVLQPTPLAQIELAQTDTPQTNPAQSFAPIRPSELDAILVSTAYVRCLHVPPELNLNLTLPSELAPPHAWCPAPRRCESI